MDETKKDIITESSQKKTTKKDNDLSKEKSKVNSTKKSDKDLVTVVLKSGTRVRVYFKIAKIYEKKGIVKEVK